MVEEESRQINHVDAMVEARDELHCLPLSKQRTVLISLHKFDYLDRMAMFDGLRELLLNDLEKTVPFLKLTSQIPSRRKTKQNTYRQ